MFRDCPHLASQDGKVKCVHRIEISGRARLIRFHNHSDFLVQLQHVDVVFLDVMEVSDEIFICSMRQKDDRALGPENTLVSFVVFHL